MFNSDERFYCVIVILVSCYNDSLLRFVTCVVLQVQYRFLIVSICK